MIRNGGMYIWQIAPKGSINRVLSLFCAYALSACTAIKYDAPIVEMSLKYQDVPLAQFKSGLRLSASDDDQEEISADEMPKTQSRDLVASDYCFVVNTTGAGIPAWLRERRGSCDNTFPGFGHMSPVFSWGNRTQIVASLGPMRFDMIGFKKSLFGAACPAQISIGQVEGGGYFLSDGHRKMTIQRGLDSLEPVVISKTQASIAPGLNIVDFEMQRVSQKPIGRLYGCQDFRIFPEPNSDDVLRSGMRKMFFNVDCPVDAEKIVVENSYGAPLSAETACDVRGKAFVKLVEPSQDDLIASEYGWYQPRLTVAAYQGSQKIASIPFKLKYSRSGKYPALAKIDQSESVRIPLSNGDDDFELLGLRDLSKISVRVRNTQASQTSDYEIPLAHSDRVPFVWNGEDAVLLSRGDTPLSNPFLLISSAFEFRLTQNDLMLEQCQWGSTCTSSFAGVKLARGPASSSLFALNDRPSSRKLVALSFDAESVTAQIFDLARQDWVSNGHGPATAKTYTQQQLTFQPTWVGAELKFVRSIAYEEARDGLKSPFKDNLIAGGSFFDSNFGARRAVLYRTPNGGKNWYRVYIGPLGSSLVDAQPLELAYKYSVDAQFKQPGFMLLEHLSDYDNAGQLLQAGELVVRIQDQHGF